MKTTVSDFIETVLNPEGRFKSLENLYPLYDNNDNLLISVNNHTVDFAVKYQGADYMLRCVADSNSPRLAKLKEISRFTGLIHSPFLPELIFLEDEMTVFSGSSAGRPSHVLLEKIPEGRPLSELLADPASGYAINIQDIINLCRDAALWLSENNFSHNRLSLKNIFFSTRTGLTFSDLSRAERKAQASDRYNLTLIAGGILIAGIDHPFYSGAVHQSLSDMKDPNRIAELLTGIYSRADLPGGLNISFAELPQATIESQLGVLDRLVSVVPSRCQLSREDKDRMSKRRGTTPRKKKYLFVGECYDMLTRVFDGKMWHYIDEYGNCRISGDFISAYDFEEGRAIVETQGGHGMIDINGNAVIPCIFDDVSWNCNNNLAVVTSEGLSGLFSRDGKKLTEIEFDYIHNVGDELFPARKDGKYGYLRRDGSTAIEFRFDDAFSFRDGIAMVEIAGSRFHIDESGKKVK